MSGTLATDGRALVVTITHDDLAWARSVLHSIPCHPVALDADADESEVVPVH